MRKAPTAMVASLVLVGLIAVMHPAFGASSDESAFLSRTNGERTSRSISGVALDAGLSDVARRHSQDMANRHELYHNDNLGNEVSNWEELDENVGVGPSVDAIHDAFMDSDVHRRAILGNYERVGIGTAWKDGELWVTEIFFRARKSSATTVRRTASAPRRTTSAAPRRRAGVPIPAAPAPPVPVAPPAPVSSLPAISSGKLQKLLGDLIIAGAFDETFAGDEHFPQPTPDTRLASHLWSFVEAA